MLGGYRMKCLRKKAEHIALVSLGLLQTGRDEFLSVSYSHKAECEKLEEEMEFLRQHVIEVLGRVGYEALVTVLDWSISVSLVRVASNHPEADLHYPHQQECDTGANEEC